MLYGEGFRRPTHKVLRLARAAKGARMFEADELRRMIDTASQPMKAMLLLAINAALGNSDVAKLCFPALDLERGWLNYPRGKTGIMRRCPLWSETVQAIEEWQAPAAGARGTPTSISSSSPFAATPGIREPAITLVTHECRKLLDAAGINGNRNFYAIRHTWETIAGESRDQVAVNAIMGHAPSSNDMASVYDERMSDERLQAVAEFCAPGFSRLRRPRRRSRSLTWRVRVKAARDFVTAEWQFGEAAQALAARSPLES